MNAASTIGRACGGRSTCTYGLATSGNASCTDGGRPHANGPRTRPPRAGKRTRTRTCNEARNLSVPGLDQPALRQPVLEDLQLVPHGAGQLVAELLEPLGDLRDLLAPLVLVDGEGLVDLLGGHVQTRDVERVRRGDVPDRGLLRRGGALEALDDPLEHPAVLAEARPQEAAVLVAAEPVHVEDARQLDGVVLLAGLHPVAEVVAGVVADERQHGERVAADDADRARGSRRRLR